MGQTEEFLEHYGKKGMRWGVRRGKSQKATKKVSSDYKRVAEIRKKSPTQLTNKQLKEANERLNLEQNFNRLNPNKVKSGQMKANAIMATLGVGVSLYNMANSPAGKAAISAGKKAIKTK